MDTKLNVAAMAAVLAVVATSGIGTPAFAADNPSYDSCFSLAVERGSGRDKGGGTKEASQHRSFMEQCMAGKIPMNATTNAANAATVRVPGNAFASTTTSRRAIRHSAQ